MSDADIESHTKATASSEASAARRAEASLSRIAARDGTFHAVSRLFEQQARQRAAQLDERISQGEMPGKLHGVPYLTKELVDIEGQVTRFGSGSYAIRPAERTAPGHRTPGSRRCQPSRHHAHGGIRLRQLGHELSQGHTLESL